MRYHAALAILCAACGAAPRSGPAAGDGGPGDDSGSVADAGAGGDAGGDAGPCGALAALVALDSGAACVDRYEEALRVALPDGGEGVWPYYDAVDGLDGGYRAVPAAAEKPQGYVSAVQAAAACAASGKRLCRSDEWLAACRGPQSFTYPYGDTYVSGWCNEGRATNPVIDLYGPNATFSWSEMNDPRLDQLPNTVAPGGSFAQCESAWGTFDQHGNLDEWVADVTGSGNGIFRGGYFVDAKLNGPGCLYTTTAHATSYHDYSTGFRCCFDPQ